MKIAYEVSTQALPNGDIVQELSSVGDFRERIYTQIFHTQDVQIREALIKLGWMPPPK